MSHTAEMTRTDTAALEGHRDDVCAYVGLGSNLGDRLATLRSAVEAIDGSPEATLVAVSPVFETAPVGGPAQGDYLNAVVAVSSSVGAPALLAALLRIEGEHGRTRGGQRDEPRTLDLDLLLFGDEVIEAANLSVPHPRLAERAFVLEPLRRLAPALRHPTLERPISELADALRDADAVRVFADPVALFR